MNRTELLALYDSEERVAMVWPSFVREEVGSIVRYTSEATNAGGFIAYSRLDGASAEQAIREQIDYYAGRRLRFSWKLYGHDHPADLAGRLVAHGLVPQDPESIMVLDLRQTPAELLRPVGLDIRRISDREGLSDVEQVMTSVWKENKADLIAELGYTMEHNSENLSVYVAYHDQTPVSAAWLRITEGRPFASLWGGSTLEAYRKRGFYTALLATRVQEALKRGADYLTVDAGPMSKPIVERFGFAELTTACDYDYTPTA